MVYALQSGSVSFGNIINTFMTVGCKCLCYLLKLGFYDMIHLQYGNVI